MPKLVAVDINNLYLLKPDEVADKLNVSKAQVYKLIAGKQIPSLRIGKAIRVPSDGLAKYISNLIDDQKIA